MTNEKYNEINDINLKVGDKVFQLDVIMGDAHATIKKLEVCEYSIKVWHKHNDTNETCFWECDSMFPCSKIFRKLNESQYAKLKRLKGIYV